MKWKVKNKIKDFKIDDEWTAWFAWYPVKARPNGSYYSWEEYWVWCEIVYRRRIRDGYNHLGWEYLLDSQRLFDD